MTERSEILNALKDVPGLPAGAVKAVAIGRAEENFDCPGPAAQAVDRIVKNLIAEAGKACTNA